MSEPTIQTQRLSRVEYERMIEAGILDEDARIELLEGQLVVREPQGSPHATAIQLAAEALRVAFGPGWSVRVQLPLALDEHSEPEPDVAAVPGAPRDYREAHPSRPVLVVEVAGASLGLDRTVKAGLYARAGVPDYWIVNLVDRVLEIRREPAASDLHPLGWDYRLVTVLEPTAAVSPLAAPTAEISVADLLP
ncbi:MAG: Uma2 family endonuclease [Candidatus Rokubacteria bacterium]|nr:Uma2 family endonuclease [Candidatus Rokubacteria bacterium]